MHSESTTDLSNLHFNLNSNIGDRDNVVLIMTGALNPIHRGHISIMIKTREHLERVNNFNVIAGYISPTHDDYVRRKLKNELILGRHRIEMCRRAIDEARQQHWLSIDKAECVGKLTFSPIH
ncbi:unnamed protein product [Rotaria sp. Silwood1]|nr:unnamed protein product [Rotaria sp. Silwood1]